VDAIAASAGLRALPTGNTIIPLFDSEVNIKKKYSFLKGFFFHAIVSTRSMQ
jgi:hypothetical protein